MIKSNPIAIHRKECRCEVCKDPCLEVMGKADILSRQETKCEFELNPNQRTDEQPQWVHRHFKKPYANITCMNHVPRYSKTAAFIPYCKKTKNVNSGSMKSEVIGRYPKTHHCNWTQRARILDKKVVKTTDLQPTYFKLHNLKATASNEVSLLEVD